MEAAAAAAASGQGVPPGCDKLWYAHLQLRRRDYDKAAEICTEMLTANPTDQARERRRQRTRQPPRGRLCERVSGGAGEGGRGRRSTS